MSLELLSSLCFYSFIQQIFAEHLLCSMHFSRPLGSKSMQPTGELHRLSILSRFPTGLLMGNLLSRMVSRVLGDHLVNQVYDDSVF